jgi:hypothetical protein
MQPNQKQPTYPVDYLNQIAPKAPKKSLLNRKQLIIAVGTALLLITFIIIIVVRSNFTSQTQSIQRLAARLQATAEIVSDSHQSIKSSRLRSLNSNLSIFLTNANRDIAEPVIANGLDIKKLGETIVTAENSEELTKTLEDARLNAVFDRTYTREMAYQLETIMVLMQQINSKTNNTALKEFLSGSQINLEPIQKEFAEFNATAS